MSKKIGFVSRLKKLASRNVLLYKIWFFTIRNYRGDSVRLPSKDDDFYFDGYPRSGNTFFVNLVKRVYPNKRFAHHLHVIAGLKIALNFGLPTFVIIRKPKDAVISHLYTKVIRKKGPLLDHRLIENLLVSYYQYYSFVKENIDDINILSFDLCINDELLVVQQIADIVNFEVKANDYLKETLNNYQKMMKRK